ncbi:putative pectinesterase 63 [Typha angustifolia]|uniref:putative pectinesterase 63 n=1 Tax=Typha angustifolia TaxID=59011 RepID=UPI003C2F0BF5
MDTKLSLLTLAVAFFLANSILPTSSKATTTTTRRRYNFDKVLVGAENGSRIIRVRKDGTGDFTTIGDAVDDVPPGNMRRTYLVIGPGVYREKVTVDRTKPFVTLVGDENAMPTISYGETAASCGSTFLSATVAVESDYFVACNIIFENTAPKPGHGVEGAQAIAMRISGDKAAFYNCKFYGYQDTLCDDQGRHFFKNCFIQGSIDFIFGNGKSMYKSCELRSVADGIAAITAQGRTRSSEDSGFSFVQCRITGTGAMYLGRAWRPSARVIYAYTYMSSIVDPKGWNDWGFSNRDRTIYYGEYKCMGPGSSTANRVNYTRILDDEEAKQFLHTGFIQAQTWLLPPPSL